MVPVVTEAALMGLLKTIYRCEACDIEEQHVFRSGRP
jgi:hypothetical protein